MKVSPEDFVRAWQASNSQAEVAGKLGMSIPGVSARAQAYRMKGVRLKRFPTRVPTTLDVGALNAIIDDGQEPAAPSQGRKKSIPDQEPRA